MTTDALGGAPPVDETTEWTWVERLAAAWARVKRLYLFLLPIRFSFIALGAVAFAFLLSDQGHDIIAAMTENDPTTIGHSSHPIQRFFFVPLVTFLALQVWYWSRTLLRVRVPGMPEAVEYPRLTAFAPRALGVLAYVIMLGALYRVGREYGAGGDQPLKTLWRLAAGLAVAAVLFVIFVVMRRSWLESRGSAVTDQKPARQLAGSTKFMIAGSLVIATVFFLWSTFSVQSAAQFGSMSVVLLSLSLWVSFGSLLVAAAMKARVPIFTVLLLVAVFSSPFADNHTLKTIGGTADLVAARPTVAQAFQKWSARLAHDYPNEPVHPVFIVATEGGGIRAAYWTAAVLTALDDDIPGFRDHLFAVSAVSGGSLGSATYASLMTRQKDVPGSLPTLRPTAKEMLAGDALAPTLSALTQQDFLQRFIAYPFLPDRARALEGGWERMWRDTNHGDDRVAHGFVDMMKGREDRMPSFFFNGTTVETGSRLIGSNLRITPAEFSDALDVYDASGADLRVSTSAHNSARFSYLSPAGTVVRGARPYKVSTFDCKPGERCEHVIDGGYFDNSGAITAAEVANVIRNTAKLPVQPYVIVIDYAARFPAPPTSERFLNETLSPVRGLANARGARAVLAVTQLAPQIGSDHVIDFRLTQYPNTVPLPLGWLLSLATRGEIDAQVGRDSKYNVASMKQVAGLIQRPLLADKVQIDAASAPAVQEMLKH